MKHEPEKKKRESKRKGFATVQLSETEFVRKKEIERDESFGKRKPAHVLGLQERLSKRKCL